MTAKPPKHHHHYLLIRMKNGDTLEWHQGIGHSW